MIMKLVARFVLAFALVTLASSASAQLSPPRVNTTRDELPKVRAVSVVICGPGDEARLLSATILELLSRLQLTMVDPPSQGASDLLAHVEIDLGGTNDARVLVRSKAGAVVLDRTVRDPNPAILREQIAHAVRGAAEAELLADEDRAAGREPTSTPPPKPEAPPPAEPAPPRAEENAAATAGPSRHEEGATTNGLALDVSSFVAGGPVARTAGPVMRVGGAAALAYRRGLRPSLALSALYAFPFESGDDVLGARTRLVSTRAAMGIELMRTGWLGLEISGGGGIDVIGVEPTSSVLPASAMREGTTRVDPILSGALTMRTAVASDVTLSVSVVGDADLTVRKYVFEDGGLRGVVFSPWSMRPLLQVGFSFTAFGDRLFPPSPPPSARGSASR